MGQKLLQPDVLKALVVSNFNAEIFKDYLNHDAATPHIEADVAPFGQVGSVLLDAEHWKTQPDLAVVWTQPESVIASFARLVDYRPVSIHHLLADVDDYADLLLQAGGRARYCFVPTWVRPAQHRGYGLLDRKPGVGFADALTRMNLRLSEKLGHSQNHYVLDAERWLLGAGREALNPKLWYMTKTAFGSEVLRAAARDVKAALRGLAGQARRLVVVDLDDTLWGGILGDVGWQHLTLGGHDPVGEAFVDFQRALQSLTHRGVVLGIVSKNDESLAIEAIENHPEMVLELDDFAAWRINWQDKAQNLVDLADELRLGLDSVVFIDDSAVERARVRDALPDVLVPEWPDAKMSYRGALLSLDCFDSPGITGEDRDRAHNYTAERKRNASRPKVGSVNDWLRTLDIAVEAQELQEATVQRAVQLLNKTNQMNLTTRRLTAAELAEWMGPTRRLWTFHVSDKYGNSGLTGVLSLDLQGTKARIVDFVLSCRVLGRRIEESMLHVATVAAKQAGAKELSAQYLPTPRNAPCLEFWRQCGFTVQDADVFSWRFDRPFPLPDSVRLETH